MKKLFVSALALLACNTQAFASEPWDPAYEPPRMADGTPDMQGIWTSASITVLERPDGIDDLILSEIEALALEQGTFEAYGVQEDMEPTDPDAPALAKGDSSIRGAGGYNSFWVDFGNKVGRINGEPRSSWVVEPETGKLPWAPEGAMTFMQVGAQMTRNFDDPEVRPAAERCTIGFGSTGGPPMINVLYNNHYQIVQSPETVAILVEMNHNTRLVRMNSEHRPGALRGWLGDSIGRWEGDTLVVNTTNFHPDAGVRGAIRHRFYLSAEAKVEERFTLKSDDEIFYEFYVDDPSIYTQVWKGEMPLRRAEGPIYEYACHEANYSLPNILAGARRQEAEAAGN
ncbi:hypothetical protein [Parvularcula sp. IMCC14364]|uniref:hypothetical protein n=1 Tax=Parvularcula sp. IMCC14364 TaxID=3067902 RepID=UPI0027413230|nr:hypothetical protein [Parvularcula sp. IMCC14364]